MPSLTFAERGAHSATSYQGSSGPLAEFLEAVEPQVRTLLLDFELEPAAAETILRETVGALVWKWESVRDRESWLLAVLARRCQAVASRRNVGSEHER